ncbi:MAG: acetyl-CoA carboxylase biotin carboxyl carrier protein [Candidatus Limnocylindrus sp.]
MAEKRRVRLQKSARRALEAARDAARRARGNAPEVVPPSGVTPPSTPAIERLAPRNPARLIESALPPAVSSPAQSTPPRPRKGESRTSARLQANMPLTTDDAALIEIVDRLAVVADGSGLAEVELAADGTRVVVRSRSAVQGSHVTITGAAPASQGTASAAPVPLPTGTKPATAAQTSAPAPSGLVVNAPLTGIFYAAPSPGAPALVSVGSIVAVGQPIGLIEAMKLFNEIKSDKAGRVVRIIAQNGQLVKAKTPIIEVEPT